MVLWCPAVGMYNKEELMQQVMRATNVSLNVDVLPLVEKSQYDGQPMQIFLVSLKISKRF
jgi:hypothetical protein